MTVIIERIEPNDEHDRQKYVRLVGRVEGAPQETWKTATLPVSQLASKSNADMVAALTTQINKLEADVVEYHANYMALNDIDTALAELGVKKQERGE